MDIELYNHHITSINKHIEELRTNKEVSLFEATPIAVAHHIRTNKDVREIEKYILNQYYGI